jgi:hypothetical protein
MLVVVNNLPEGKEILPRTRKIDFVIYYMLCFVIVAVASVLGLGFYSFGQNKGEVSVNDWANLAEDAVLSPKQRLDNARRVLGSRAQNYDQNFLQRTFGVNQMSTDVYHIGGVVKEIGRKNIRLDTGDSTLTFPIDEISNIWWTDDLACDAFEENCESLKGITLKDVRMGDYVGIMYFVTVAGSSIREDQYNLIKYAPH